MSKGSNEGAGDQNVDLQIELLYTQLNTLLDTRLQLLSMKEKSVSRLAALKAQNDALKEALRKARD